MLEDEIVHLIQTDDQIKELIIVENRDCQGIVQKLNELDISFVLLPESKLPHLKPASDYRLIVNMLEFALHAIPSKLKDTVYNCTRQMCRYSDGILLFYGLCGNVLGNIENDLADLDCNIHILKEEDGEVIDDCIGVVLGGRANYLSTLKSFKGVGTFFLTPMWAANWREMLVAGGFGSDPNDTDTSKKVFDAIGYRNVARLDTGLYYEKDFDDIVHEFADIFDFDILHLEGNLDLVEKCYYKLREEITQSY